jgi:hypothetical protein
MCLFLIIPETRGHIYLNNDQINKEDMATDSGTTMLVQIHVRATSLIQLQCCQYVQNASKLENV